MINLKLYMKQLRLILLLLCVSVYSNAQVQQGYVKTVGKRGQRGTPLNGVVLKTIYAKSSTVISGSDGKFSFPVNGNQFQMSLIKKNNYQLADEDIIGRNYSYMPSSPVVFAMVSLDEYHKAQRAIEERALNKYKKIFDEKAKKLENELEYKQISNDEYVKRIEELENETSSFQQMISKLSDLYARTDYDDIDSLDILINQYIEEGEYDLAATLVDSKGDIRKRIADTKEKEKNAAMLRSIAEKETQSVEREKQSIINDLGVKIQIAQSKMQLDSVQYWIEFRADYDSTNVEYQMEALQNLMTFRYPKTTKDRRALWEHYDKNRRYIYRALEYLKNSGQEYSTETLKCLDLLYRAYREELYLTNYYDAGEAMEIVDKMIGIEMNTGIEPITSLSRFYDNLSFLMIIAGKDSQIFQEYYQKSLSEKYEETAILLNKDVENTFFLFSLYKDMRDCIPDKNKQKEIDKIRLNLYLKHKEEDILKTVDVTQIYIDLGETKKAIQYQKYIVAELEKQNELNNNIESRRQLLEQYRMLVDCLEKVGNYKSMREYTWKLYELYKADKEQFSTYITRFESAKNLQKYVYASIMSKQFSDVEKMIVESFKMAEDASNFGKAEYYAFIFKNYIYLSQLYAYRHNYSLAISAVAKARAIYPDDEEAKNVEIQIMKKSKIKL